MGLEAAVEATLEFLNKAVKPVMVGGVKLRVAKASDAFVDLADASGYAMAVMPTEDEVRRATAHWGAAATHAQALALHDLAQP